MIMYRTFNVIGRILKSRKENLLTKWRTMHFLIYGLGIVCLVPFIWQIAFFEGVRKTWVISYCDAVTRK